MALAWRWILEQLCGNLDVSVACLQEILKYAGENLEPDLKNRLLLRHLDEVLAFSGATSTSIIQESALTEEEKATVAEWMSRLDSQECRRSLFNFVKEKKARLGPSTLEQIASDVICGVYPGEVRQDQASSRQAEVQDQCVQAPATNGRARHLSVGSEDTTVIINGNKSPARIHNDDQRNPALKRPLAAEVFGSFKRLCRDRVSNIFGEKDAAKDQQEDNAVSHEATEKQVDDTNMEHGSCHENEADEFHFVDTENVNTRRPKRLAKDTDSAGEERSQLDVKMSKQVPVVEVDQVQEMEFSDLGPDKHTETCIKCKRRGKLICCDGCPVAMHPRCVGVEEIPEEDWYCPFCVLKQARAKMLKAKEEAQKAQKLCSTIFTAARHSSVLDDGVGEFVKAEPVSPLRMLESVTSPTTFNSREKIPGVRRPALPWTQLEEETLREGVKLYSKGNGSHGFKWTKILQFGQGKFDASRTAVDLKDKWRNLNRGPEAESKKKQQPDNQIDDPPVVPQQTCSGPTVPQQTCSVSLSEMNL